MSGESSNTSDNGPYPQFGFEVPLLEGEEYVGGVASGRMLRAGGIAGYAIYVTTRRIIGAKNRKLLWKGIAGSALGIPGMYIGAKLSRDQNAQMIDEVEQKKDFEVAKENASSLEMKKPSFVHRGHMIVGTTTGDEVKNHNRRRKRLQAATRTHANIPSRDPHQRLKPDSFQFSDNSSE